MALVLALIGSLTQITSTVIEPPKPDFLALVPLKSKEPPAALQKQADWNARVAEAVALAKYLDKAWPKLLDGTASAELTGNCLLVVEQFDVALHALDTEPTLTDALTRIRAYRALIGAVLRNIERAEAQGLPPPATKKQVAQVLQRIDRHYRSLFSRVA